MKIGLIILISILIRFLGLNQSLWLDEAISANVAKNYSYTEIVNMFSPADFHPPTYYLMLKSWGDVFGYSEISVRMPSIIFGLITIYIVYLLGGIWPAVLVGTNPLLVYYSQEARMYSMVTLLLTLCLYFLIQKKYILVGFFGGVAFLTFYGSVFFMVAIGLYLLINKKYKELLTVTIGPIIALLLIWPLMKMQLNNSQEMLSQVTNWNLVLGKANLKNLLLIPMKFTSGRISFEPKVIYYLISGGFGALVLGKMLLESYKSKNSRIYSFIFWMTLLVGTVFSIFTPMLQYFRFLYLIPTMALALRQNKTVLGGFVIFSFVYLLNTNFYREDWKSLTTNLSKKIYIIESFGDPVKYYNNKITIKDIRGEIGETEITVVPYGEKIHGVDHNLILEQKGYKLIETINFRGLSKEIWHLST